MKPSRTVLIAGYADGLGSALRQRFEDRGYAVVGVSRHGADEWRTDLSDPGACAALFDRLARQMPPLAGVVHNAMQFHRQPFLQTTPSTLQAVWSSMVMTAFNMSQQAIPVLRAQGGGSLIFSGASGSLRAGAQFSAFSSAKFALRGLCQAIVQEHSADGIHVAHVVIDGLIRSKKTQARFAPNAQAPLIEPTDLAQQYLQLFEQPRSAWTHELDIRPAQQPHPREKDFT